MTNLSTPIGELRSRYGVVVIGSGYGGAIAAYRMTSKAARDDDRAFSVCVLERGLERRPGEFPSSLPGALREVQADTGMGHFGRRTALFDFRKNRDISVLVGCGLGGTSLINAGVMLEPLPEVLADERWPSELRAPGALDTEFADVKKMLGVQPWPDDVPLQKLTSLEQVVARFDRVGGRNVVRRPPIAVSFETRVNDYGVQQQRCVLCGDCMTGCNHAAKNTVGVNYLAAAAVQGAAIFCGVEVRTIEPGSSNNWLLHVRLLDGAWNVFGGQELTISADTVFLAAGTLGSTEILLRSRQRHGLKLSDTLGQHFSGNGDALAFSYNASETVNGIGYGRWVPRAATVGPTIAGMLDERRMESGAMIQEGAIPGVLVPFLRVAAPIMARFSNVRCKGNFDVGFRSLRRELDSLIRGGRYGALARTQTFLVMSRDDGNGTLWLSRNRIRIHWPRVGGQPVFRRVAKRVAQLTAAMKGRYVINPFWSRLFGRRLMTVHPLGGCCLADDARAGVVDAEGRVFNQATGTTVYENLRVCDGSIIPVPLGTNPALTIAALAERIAARTKPPVRDRSGSGRPPSRITPSAPGIRYTERLRGWMEVGETRTRLELVLHISAESIDELLNDSRHEARIIGVARTPDLPDVRRFTVSDGSLNVFIDDPRSVDTRLLVYRLKLTAVSSDADKVDDMDVSNEILWLYGYKRINLETCRRGTWRAISRLPFIIYRTEPPTSEAAMEPVIAAQVCNAIDQWSGSNGSAPPEAAGGGLVASRVVDALRLIASLQVMYERRLRARVRVLARYAWYFAGVIFQARVWPLRPALRADPLNRPDLQRHAPSIERLPDLQDNRRTGPPRFLLARYVKPSKAASRRPPLILAPGFGMSSDAFLVGKRSIVEHLCNAGYEVVLLDYRGSDRIDLSLSQFTLDDLVGDFCDAIELVHATTGQPVRFIGHCVASLTMLMALLSGGPKGEGIKGLHSVVLSQSFAFLDHPWTNRLKARLRLPHILKYLRFREVLTPDYDLRSRWVSHLLDRLLHFYPTRERCTSGVCRRLLLLYGEVVRHDQLDQATHALLYDLFDRANLTSLEHLAKMVARGRIVDARGRNVYVTEQAAKNINVPITLLQGDGNRLFRPSGARATYHWLLEHGRFGPRNREMFSLREIPGVGHLDTFIGRDAADRVFPAIDEALEQMQFQMSRA